MVGLVRVVPIIVFSLISGVVADVFDRRKLMLITQLGGTIVASILAALAFMGITVVWPIYVLAAIGAAVGAFDLPARQALVPTLVPREHLPNAISLNTVMLQVASVGGPALGGVLIALDRRRAGRTSFNAISFLVVIVALLMMRDVPKTERGKAPRRRRDVDQGRARRPALRVPLAADPLDDAAGFLRDVLLVGDGAAADLRAGHPARRPARLRLAVRGAGRRREPRQRRDGAAGRTTSTGAAACSSGRSLGLRPGDRRLRLLARRSG